MIYYCKDVGFDNALIKELEIFCSKERIEKANDYKNIVDKKNSLLVYSLFQYALKKEYGFMLDKDDAFLYNENGKPYLKNKKICFSFSHCKNAVAVAISNKNVGIDVQDFRKISDSLTNKTMSQKERAEILKNKNDFYKFWSLKEAYIKYNGENICSDLKKMDFSSVKNVLNGEYVLSFTNDFFSLSIISKEKFTDNNVREVSVSDIIMALK